MGACGDISTGRMLGSHSSPAQDSETQTTGALFDALSEYSADGVAHSHNLEVGVDGCGYVVRAFGLAAGDKLEVEQLVGSQQGDEFNTPLAQGTWPFMDAANNIALLILPGRYRFRYTGTNLGAFTVTAQRVPQGTLAAAVAAFDIVIG